MQSEEGGGFMEIEKAKEGEEDQHKILETGAD
jgi:hypothetical protein